jgi:hypothetical protein
MGQVDGEIAHDTLLAMERSYASLRTWASGTANQAGATGAPEEGPMHSRRAASVLGVVFGAEVVVGLTIGLLGLRVAASAGQRAERPRPRRLTSVERADAEVLIRLVDAVVRGQPTGGDAWLRWHGHFLRAPDGRTYVPFTVTLHEAPREAFRSVALYVRVTERGDTLTRAERIKQMGGVGFRSGEVPVNVPERQFAPPGAPTPGEASAALRLHEESQKAQKPPYVFEDVHFLDLEPAPAGAVRLVRRALLVPPGQYDLYVALRERSGARGAEPRAVVHKQPLDVPDLARPGLTLSSLIVTERVDVLARPLSPDEQVRRPYALGTAELIPALDLRRPSNGELALAFLIYGFAVDRDGKPELRVDYRFYEPVGITERLFIETTPQEFTAATLPPTFDGRRERQLAVTQAVPLTAFPPGPYRLEVTVTDRIASATARGELRFVVGDETARR